MSSAEQQITTVIVQMGLDCFGFVFNQMKKSHTHNTLHHNSQTS